MGEGGWGVSGGGWWVSGGAHLEVGAAEMLGKDAAKLGRPGQLPEGEALQRLTAAAASDPHDALSKKLENSWRAERSTVRCSR